MLDENHQVIFANRQPDELLCQSMLVGREFHSILEEKDRPAAATALAHAKRGEMASFTASYTRPTGEKIWFDTMVNETSDASGRFIVVAR
ncbi:PAS domain-containing protein, partial [Enterococcus casseliflavus]|uniref:PAS domain-containing protein n=1 Tax=Enterococcus casseliflavus TaxID=37734 RepID=UPI003D0E041F